LSLLRRILLLRLRLPAWLAWLVFTTTPAAPMSLRLSLTIRRGCPQLLLGNRRFCCHACTSWHIAVDCIRSLASAPISGAAEFLFPPPALLSQAIPGRSTARLS